MGLIEDALATVLQLTAENAALRARVAELELERQGPTETSADRRRRQDRARKHLLKDRIVPPEQRRRILQRDGYRCQRCGDVYCGGPSFHVDHIRPMKHGGGRTDENLQTLCPRCNLNKGAAWGS